ncbi:MAG: hypothetical protein JXQ83_03925, partial [Candidatus Glassbacteria bacterium]|nr:hypothetical protein [Candidatus Glassbacteria bacterium]
EGAGTPDESVKAVGGVIAGEDPVAVDAVAAMLAGFDPLDMEYLDLAGELSLGVADRERIEVLGEVGLEEGRVPLARPRRLFSDENLAAPEFPYQGQGVRRLLYGFSSGPQGDGQEEVHLPFPGMEGWVAAERSPDEPLGPGDDGSGEGSWYGFTYYRSAREAAAELWVGSRVPLKVLLNGATVLERTREQIDSEGGFRVPNQTVDVELPAGCGTLEVYGEYEDSGDRDSLFSLHLARRDEERKYAGSRVPGLIYFLDPAGDQSRSGVVGTAAPGHSVEASLWDGTTQTAACGAQGAFVLKELDPDETLLRVYNPYGRVVADSSVYLEEWTTHRVDFQVPAGGPAVTGDYSGDGRLAVNDVIALLLGMRDYPEDTYFDFNGDGRLNVSDAVALLLFMRPG